MLTPGPFRRLFDRPSADASPDLGTSTSGPNRGPTPVEAPSSGPGPTIPPLDRLQER
jgi:hypothetical protein